MTTFRTADRSDVLGRHWIALSAADSSKAAELREQIGVDFSVAAAKGRVWETDNFIYLPVVVNFKRREKIEREAIMFALGSEYVVTLQPGEHFAPFDKAIAKMRRQPELAESAYGVMYALLWALNEASERVIEYASDALEAMNDEIEMATEGYDAKGREIGVGDMRGVLSRMNEAEEIVSRTQESQLLLARAARHLMAETPKEATSLDALIGILLADIDGVKEHAGFEHDKVRYLQQSVMTWLDVKQNQIVKVFTIITAVFLPPTLIATFYGMNFTWMPELEWQHGFLVTTLFTLVAAVIPLAYIKQKGWLR
ncbi:magnesium transporter CorA [Mycolicibacterium wolinskyi]|uniref:magnesium transporter CorA family protein n=1 Tax=Mycolicibacterium TaxID=1866885 RepID=UPI000AC45089|nr:MULTISPECIES: CorA family divalent cation transporter [Mycolicibacterium]MCV7289106.1 magnesium transporter CorA [Mycolicibacterium wolinskyi]MCV7296533.1 magnesium transporter CorA [Mycolicibacterium goodii]